MASPVVSATSPWASSNNITSPEARLALSASWAKSPTSSIQAEGGVVEGANPGASISGGQVSVTPHQVIVEASGGTYVGTWPTTRSVALDSVPAAGQSRRDLLVGEISDSGDNAVYQIRPVTGVASASPSTPATPANTVPLFVVPVSNSGPQTPTPVNQYTRAPGGSRLVSSTDTRPGSYTGHRRKRVDGGEDVWTGSAWLAVIAPASWTQENTSLYANGQGSFAGGEVGIGTGGTKMVRYKRTGNDLTVSYAFRWGTQPFSNPAGKVTTVIPQGLVTPAARDQWIPCALWVNDPVSKVLLDYQGMALVQSSSNILRPYYPRSNGSGGFATGMFPYQIATGSGPGVGIPYIAAGYPQGGTLHIGPALLEVAG